MIASNAQGVPLDPGQVFAKLLHQYMDQGLCADPARVPKDNRWDHDSLAIELRRVARGRSKARYLETIKKILRAWADGETCPSQKRFVMLCEIFFGTKNDPRRLEFERARRNFDQAQRERLIEFGHARSSTLRAIYDFDIYCEPDGKIVPNIPWELFKDWWHEYRSGFFCAFRNGKPIAVFGLFPVTAGWRDNFFKGSVSEFQLTADVLKLATRPGQARLHWYLSGLSWRGGQGAKKHLPRFLAKSICQWIRSNVQHVGYEPIEVLSEGATTPGERLLNNRFGFEPISGLDTERPRFVLKTTLEGLMHELSRSDFFTVDEAVQNDAEAIRAHVHAILRRPPGIAV